MVSEDGNRVLIDSYYDAIPPASEEELALYETLTRKFAARFLTDEKMNARAWINNWSDAEALRHLIFDSSMNIDGLWSGYAGPGMATILPERAAAKIDCRLVPDQAIKLTLELVRRHLEEHSYSDIEIIPVGGDECSQTSITTLVVQALLSVYRYYGIEAQVWPREAGSGLQTRFTQPPLSQAAAYGGLGHAGRARGTDEYIVIEGNKKVAGLVRAGQSHADILCAYACWLEG